MEKDWKVSNLFLTLISSRCRFKIGILALKNISIEDKRLLEDTNLHTTVLVQNDEKTGDKDHDADKNKGI